MKRDMELIRLLLLEIEQDKEPAGLDAYDEAQQVYHSALLVERGLANGLIVPGGDSIPAEVIIRSLTWEGHDFLDAARNEKIWRKTTKFLKDKGIDVTFEVLKQLLTKYAKEHLGLP